MMSLHSPCPALLPFHPGLFFFSTSPFRAGAVYIPLFPYPVSSIFFDRSPVTTARGVVSDKLCLRSSSPCSSFHPLSLSVFVLSSLRSFSIYHLNSVIIVTTMRRTMCGRLVICSMRPPPFTHLSSCCFLFSCSLLWSLSSLLSDLSPELCDNRDYNAKSDVWGLGCLLYETATLHHAFDGNNLPALIANILEGAFHPFPNIYSNELKACLFLPSHCLCLVLLLFFLVLSFFFSFTSSSLALCSFLRHGFGRKSCLICIANALRGRCSGVLSSFSDAWSLSLLCFFFVSSPWPVGCCENALTPFLIRCSSLSFFTVCFFLFSSFFLPPSCVTSKISRCPPPIHLLLRPSVIHMTATMSLLPLEIDFSCFSTSFSSFFSSFSDASSCLSFVSARSQVLDQLDATRTR